MPMIWQQTASKAVGWAAAFAEAYGAELHLVQVVIPTSPTDTEFGAAERTRGPQTDGEAGEAADRHGRSQQRPRFSGVRLCLMQKVQETESVSLHELDFR